MWVVSRLHAIRCIIYGICNIIDVSIWRRVNEKNSNSVRGFQAVAMKVLVLSAYYVPEVAASMYIPSNLYEDLAKSGCEVVIHTPIPTRGVDNETRQRFKRIRIEHSCADKLIIHRFPLFRESTNPILRICRYMILSFVLFWKGLITDTDVIFVQSTPPTQGALGAILKIIKRVPLVYNLQDIFPESLVTTGLTSQSSLLWRLGRMIEKFTYQYVDKVIVISEGFRRNLLSKGVYEDKIVVIPNWVDENVVSPIQREHNMMFEKYNLDSRKFYISHCGNIGLTQNMDMLIDVAEDLKEHKDIGFLLIGDGAYKKAVQDKISQKDLTNVQIIPFQPYEYISHVFSAGEVGVVISKASVGQSSIPSKTWSIMSAERAVLASFDQNSELASIITSHRCGICVSPEDRIALKNAILNLYNNRINLKNMGTNGRKYIIENLTREKGTSRYIEAIRNVVP